MSTQQVPEYLKVFTTGVLEFMDLQKQIKISALTYLTVTHGASAHWVPCPSDESFYHILDPSRSEVTVIPKCLICEQPLIM